MIHCLRKRAGGDGEYRNKSARFLTYERAIQLGRTFLQKGDVLIARMPDPLGRACIFPGDSKPAVTVVDVAIVRSANVELNHWWLMYFVNAPAFRAAVASMQSGSTRKRISRGNLSKISLPVSPLDQQKRIVAEIEKQFSRLDEAVANLKRYKAAVKGCLVETEAELARRAGQGSANVAGGRMPGATEGRNYETGEQLLQRILETRRRQWKGKGKYKEPAAPDTTDLPELSEGWVWATVEQVATLVTDGDHNPPKRTAAGVPHLTAKHIREWRVESADCTFISREDATKVFKRYLPKAGDVIVTCVDTIGRTAIVPDGFEFSPDRNLAAIRLLPSSVNVHFLQLILESPEYQKLMLGASESTAQSHLYLSDLHALLIPVPSSAEQQRIITVIDRCLSFVGEVDTQVDANLKRAERLRAAILREAFLGSFVCTSGEIRRH